MAPSQLAVVIETITPEQQELLTIFGRMLNEVSKDGGRKRAAGMKVSWKVDTHERQLFSHLYKWKKGELHDDHSGQHPLVHLAWRALAIAWQESQMDSDATGYKENVANSTGVKALLGGNCCMEHARQRSEGMALRKTLRWDQDYITSGGSGSLS